MNRRLALPLIVTGIVGTLLATSRSTALPKDTPIKKPDPNANGDIKTGEVVTLETLEPSVAVYALPTLADPLHNKTGSIGTKGTQLQLVETTADGEWRHVLYFPPNKNVATLEGWVPTSKLALAKTLFTRHIVARTKA